MIRHFVALVLLANFVLGEQKLVCYWMHGNPVSNIDPNTCTHIHFSFATLDSSSLLMRFDESSSATDLTQLKKLKTQNPGLKIVIALGGGTDDVGGKYGKMVLSTQSRANFVSSAVKFINENGFDGLDFDWEYPACPQTTCDEAHAPEKAAFASLLKELRTAFDKNSPKLSLSVAVNAGKWLADKAYDYPTMASALDYINVMTYDNAGPWLKTTNHHSGFQWSTDALANFWAKTGIPKSKFLMGVPFYGIGATLIDPNHHDIGEQVTQYTGPIVYNEICKSGWTKARTTNDGPYAYQGNKWIGYDDPTSAAVKAKWVRDNGFGGILVWEVGQDDISGACCKQAKPMIKALGYGLFGKGADPSTYGCK